MLSLLSVTLYLTKLLYFYRKLYWADQGGFGVPPKIGKINMDGSNPQVLINDGHTPEAIAIDLEQKNIYYSTQYPSNVNYLNKSILTIRKFLNK